MLVIFISVILATGLYFLFKKKKLSLSKEEQLIVRSAVSVEQKALSDFSIGKEELIAEYESLKLRVKNVKGLQAKLPLSPIPIVQPD